MDLLHWFQYQKAAVRLVQFKREKKKQIDNFCNEH